MSLPSVLYAESLFPLYEAELAQGPPLPDPASIPRESWFYKFNSSKDSVPKYEEGKRWALNRLRSPSLEGLESKWGKKRREAIEGANVLEKLGPPFDGPEDGELVELKMRKHLARFHPKKNRLEYMAFPALNALDMGELAAYKIHPHKPPVLWPSQVSFWEGVKDYADAYYWSWTPEAIEDWDSDQEPENTVAWKRLVEHLVHQRIHGPSRSRMLLEAVGIPAHPAPPRHTEVQATSSAATQILARLKRLKENPQ
jgi:hypothetical protein